MDNSVRIAAVIVTYNRKELLKENIKSLLLQDRALDGIIIIDNHSTDGTQEHVVQADLNMAQGLHMRWATISSG